jgi:hypothetical protein
MAHCDTFRMALASNYQALGGIHAHFFSGDAHQRPGFAIGHRHGGNLGH